MGCFISRLVMACLQGTASIVFDAMSERKGDRIIA